MKILLVEDEAQLAEVIGELLKQNLHEVDMVYNGNEGEEYALTGVYDAIILDIMLPGKSGLDVLQTLRLSGVKTPVLLLSARSEISDKISGLDRGADDYLTKPFAAGELLARIRAITRRGNEFIGDVLQAGNTILDKNTHELSSASGSVKLAAKEFQIMFMLLSNVHQIVLKERMVERIWGFDSEAEYNTIEVYITFVRRKLTAIGSNLQIKAARGRGYYLEVP